MFEGTRTAREWMVSLAQLVATVVLLGVLAAGGEVALAPLSMQSPGDSAPGGVHATSAVYGHVASYANSEDEGPAGAIEARKR